jgi:hypothetical protein
MHVALNGCIRTRGSTFPPDDSLSAVTVRLPLCAVFVYSIEEWRPYYLQYRLLKRLLEKIRGFAGKKKKEKKDKDKLKVKAAKVKGEEAPPKEKKKTLALDKCTRVC